MPVLLSRPRVALAGLSAALILAGCATPSAPPKPQGPPQCSASANAETYAGNWLSVRKQKGIAGELRVLFTLNADGTMAYTEQLKRGKNPSQGLSETGCWLRDGQKLVLQTQLSNGEPIDMSDPIYTNEYIVVSAGASQLVLQDADGGKHNAKRMSPGYRLPF